MKSMKKAFTMVELVGVIILLGLIASFMVPAFMADNASSQAKVLASKIMTDLQAIEMKNNECYDTTGNWLTKSSGSSLDTTAVDVSSLKCAGTSIEGNNRFFTPQAPTDMSTSYQMLYNTPSLWIKISWSSSLNKITQNALTQVATQITLSKFNNCSGAAITPTAAAGSICYYITK